MGACACLEDLQATFHRTRHLWTILKVTAQKEGKVGYTSRKGQDSLSSPGSSIVNNIQARSERPQFHFLLIYWEKKNEKKRKERKDKGCWSLEIIVLNGLIGEQCSYWAEPNAASHSTSSRGPGAAPWAQLTHPTFFALILGWFLRQASGFLDSAALERSPCGFGNQRLVVSLFFIIIIFPPFPNF